MWFIFESLLEMLVDELYVVGNMLIDGFEKMMSGLCFEFMLMGVWLILCNRRNIMLLFLISFIFEKKEYDEEFY